MRRRSAGTTTASDCRTTVNTGGPRAPATKAVTSSPAYGTNGATDQQTACATIEGTSARRRPYRSTTHRARAS